LRCGFLLQQKVVEMYGDTVTEILDRLQLKYGEGMGENREKFAVRATGLSKSTNYEWLCNHWT